MLFTIAVHFYCWLILGRGRGSRYVFLSLLLVIDFVWDRIFRSLVLSATLCQCYLNQMEIFNKSPLPLSNALRRCEFYICFCCIKFCCLLKKLLLNLCRHFCCVNFFTYHLSDKQMEWFLCAKLNVFQSNLYNFT